MKRSWVFFIAVALLASTTLVKADDEDVLETETVDNDLGSQREGSRTDSEVVDREAEAIKLDGLSVSQMQELRDKSEKHQFQVCKLLILFTFMHIN